MPSPTALPIQLKPLEQAVLEKIVRSHTSEQRLVRRAQILLKAHAGDSNAAIAGALGRGSRHRVDPTGVSRGVHASGDRRADFRSQCRAVFKRRLSFNPTAVAIGSMPNRKTPRPSPSR